MSHVSLEGKGMSSFFGLVYPFTLTPYPATPQNLAHQAFSREFQ